MVINLGKKGESKMVSVYWFVMLAIIAGAVVVMVSMFYGNPYDVRGIEGNIMINQFSDCVSDSGSLNSEFLNDSSLKNDLSLEDVCGFDFSSSSSVVNSQERESYYLEAEFYKHGSSELVETYEAGATSYKAQCDVQNDSQEYGRLVKCVNRSFYVANDTESAYEVNVLSAVAKGDKNVE